MDPQRRGNCEQEQRQPGQPLAQQDVHIAVVDDERLIADAENLLEYVEIREHFHCLGEPDLPAAQVEAVLAPDGEKRFEGVISRQASCDTRRRQHGDDGEDEGAFGDEMPPPVFADDDDRDENGEGGAVSGEGDEEQGYRDGAVKQAAREDLPVEADIGQDRENHE